jgi:1-acyl-sn-glycerol-3-phosphate acyltransferase
VSDGLRDLVYPPVLGVAYGMFAALGLKFDITGGEHVPTSGGAVLASNHNSFLDFIFVGLAARPSRRLVRFMAKDDVFRHRISGPLMRGMHHIPVDRSAGAASYQTAVERLRAGQVVGIFPEATISRSFMLKDIRSGAARMAAEAGVPLIPVALWGGQRIFTKARKPVLRRGRAISIAVGEPVPMDGDSTEVTTRLGERISALLDGLQRSYPQLPTGPDDDWWLPAHLGGSAPTPEHAAALDAEEAAARAARKRT